MTRSKPADFSPFSSAPDSRWYQSLGSIESCREQLENTLRHDAGLGVVIGPPGTGKSLLCQLLSETLRDSFDVVLLAETAPRDHASLLQNILFHLNMPYKNLSEGELRLSLIDRLTQTSQSREQGLVLIVDEAQTLPDMILEEVRMITNIVRGGRSCVRTVLAGNHQLEDRLGQPSMESLAQRVAVRCYLHPFNQSETGQYIRQAMSKSDSPKQVEEEAIAAIHFATGGVPRLIHQVMRQVLHCVEGDVISGEHVNQAWKRSQQLASPVLEPEVRDPSAWAEQVYSEPASTPPTELPAVPEPAPAEQPPAEPQSIVEFGELTKSSPEPAPQTPAEAQETPVETFQTVEPSHWAEPAVEADLDRVTESLLRIAGEEYDESAGLVDAEIDVVTEADAITETDALTEAVEEPQAAAESSCCAENACQQASDCQQADAGLACDISIIDASIEWDTELHSESAIVENSLPVDPAMEFPVQAEIVEPAALFGDDFEDEETVPTPHTTTAGSSSLTDSIEDDCLPEQKLHREVADLSAEASLIQLHAGDDTEESSPTVLPAAAIGTDGFGPTVGKRPAQDDIFLSDDSDMLIIEESIELEAAPIRPVVFDDDPSDSVDYQRLLNRMRRG